MIYTKKRFGNELTKQIEFSFDHKKLSHWALSIYLQHCDEFETGLDDIVMKIVAMADGYEFEISKDELLQLAKDLETS